MIYISTYYPVTFTIRLTLCEVSAASCSLLAIFCCLHSLSAFNVLNLLNIDLGQPPVLVLDKHLGPSGEHSAVRRRAQGDVSNPAPAQEHNPGDPH